ncbi:MAG: hypothetical protein KGR26_00285 [Cyanobacteria bacterium REEB65]|nr:hypothetical protein [Cyanobacteria bacterium REEB65]
MDRRSTSPEQTGLSLDTSQADTFTVQPVAPGTWTAWAEIPGMGMASASVTAAAGATVSAVIAFRGWQSGPSLPVPTGNAAVATDGRSIYVVGGVMEGGAQTAATWQLDSSAASPSWSALPAFPSAREGLVAAVVGQKLYVVGGEDAGQIYDDAWDLDLTQPTAWNPLPGPSAPDSNFRAQPFDPVAAIASGSDLLALWTFFDDIAAPPYARSHLASFATGQNAWTYDGAGLPSMRTPRRRAGAALFEGALVVAGGEREEVEQGLIAPGQALPALATVEALQGGRWSAWPDLPTPRSELALAAASGSLYAAGGTDANEVALDVVERYDPTAGAWFPAPPLSTPRSCFGLVFAGGRLWAVGGSPSRLANESGNGTAIALASVETLAMQP